MKINLKELKRLISLGIETSRDLGSFYKYLNKIKAKRC